jgi:hypothetical protein
MDAHWFDAAMTMLREDVNRLHMGGDPHRIHRTMSHVNALIREYDAARAELAQHAALVALTQQLIRNAIAPAQPMTFRDTPLTMVLVLESDLHALTEAYAALVTDGGPS